MSHDRQNKPAPDPKAKAPSPPKPSDTLAFDSSLSDQLNDLLGKSNPLLPGDNADPFGLFDDLLPPSSGIDGLLSPAAKSSAFTVPDTPAFAHPPPSSKEVPKQESEDDKSFKDTAAFAPEDISDFLRQRSSSPPLNEAPPAPLAPVSPSAPPAPSLAKPPAPPPSSFLSQAAKPPTPPPPSMSQSLKPPPPPSSSLSQVAKPPTPPPPSTPLLSQATNPPASPASLLSSSQTPGEPVPPAKSPDLGGKGSLGKTLMFGEEMADQLSALRAQHKDAIPSISSSSKPRVSTPPMGTETLKPPFSTPAFGSEAVKPSSSTPAFGSEPIKPPPSTPPLGSEAFPSPSSSAAKSPLKETPIQGPITPAFGESDPFLGSPKIEASKPSKLELGKTLMFGSELADELSKLSQPSQLLEPRPKTQDLETLRDAEPSLLFSQDKEIPLLEEDDPFAPKRTPPRQAAVSQAPLNSPVSSQLAPAKTLAFGAEEMQQMLGSLSIGGELEASKKTISDDPDIASKVLSAVEEKKRTGKNQIPETDVVSEGSEGERPSFRVALEKDRPNDFRPASPADSFFDALLPAKEIEAAANQRLAEQKKAQEAKDAKAAAAKLPQTSQASIPRPSSPPPPTAPSPNSPPQAPAPAPSSPASPSGPRSSPRSSGGQRPAIQSPFAESSSALLHPPKKNQTLLFVGIGITIGLLLLVGLVLILRS